MNLSWTDTWNDLLVRASSVVGLGLGMLWPTLATLPIVLVWAPARRWGRILVTIAHEAGHAAVDLMVGRCFPGFVVSRDLSGHAVIADKPTGLGRAAASWAGYPAPAVLSAVVVLLALKGWASAILLLGLVLLAVLLVMSRSVHTVLLVLLVVALIRALWWWGGQWRDSVVTGTGLVLLMGTRDSLRDAAASCDPSQDHRALVHLTRLPAGVWLTSWSLVDAVAIGVVMLALCDPLRGEGGGSSPSPPPT